MHLRVIEGVDRMRYPESGEGVLGDVDSIEYSAALMVERRER